MEKKLYYITMDNVWNEYIFGRIMGILDVKANLDERKYERGYATERYDEDYYVCRLESDIKLLEETLEEINKFHPYVKFRILDKKEEEGEEES